MLSGRLSPRRAQAGFSLLELSVVVLIGLTITAVGVPKMNNAIANMKLRSSMTTASGFLQNTRMLAIKQNATMTALHTSLSTPPYSLVYYAKKASDPDTTLQRTDFQVEMEAPISPYDSPTGAGAPSAITNAALGLPTGAVSLTTDPNFNPRGLPCTGTNCSSYTSYIKYFKDNRISGPGAWAAISISPAGRIKRWFWNGSAWTD